MFSKSDSSGTPVYIYELKQGGYRCYPFDAEIVSAFIDYMKELEKNKDNPYRFRSGAV